MLGLQTPCDVQASSFLDCSSKQLTATVHTVLQPWHVRRPKRDVLELTVQGRGASLLNSQCSLHPSLLFCPEGVALQSARADVKLQLKVTSAETAVS